MLSNRKTSGPRSFGSQLPTEPPVGLITCLSNYLPKPIPCPAPSPSFPLPTDLVPSATRVPFYQHFRGNQTMSKLRGPAPGSPSTSSSQAPGLHRRPAPQRFPQPSNLGARKPREQLLLRCLSCSSPRPTNQKWSARPRARPEGGISIGLVWERRPASGRGSVQGLSSDS